MRTRVSLVVGFMAVLALVAGCTSEDAAFRRVTREFPLIAWTGDRLFVYGGSASVELGDTEWPPPYEDAALWDPDTETYESVADPPFEAALNEQAGAVVVDDSVIVMGTLCESREFEEDSVSTFCEPGTLVSATYSVANDSWTSHTLPDDLAAFGHAHVDGLGATSDGRAVFSVAHRGERLWALDREGVWEALPVLPRVLRRDRTPRCMAGDTVVGLSRARDQRSVQLELLPLDAASPVWTSTPPVPPSEGERTTSSFVCGDDFVLVNTQRFDLGQSEWTPLAPPRSDVGPSAAIWTGAEVIYLREGTSGGGSPTLGLAYDPDADSWRAVHAAPVPALGAIAAGTADRPAVAAWGGRMGEAGAPTEPFYSEIRD